MGRILNFYMNLFFMSKLKYLCIIYHRALQNVWLENKKHFKLMELKMKKICCAGGLYVLDNKMLNQCIETVHIGNIKQ